MCVCVRVQPPLFFAAPSRPFLSSLPSRALSLPSLPFLPAPPREYLAQVTPDAHEGPSWLPDFMRRALGYKHVPAASVVPVHYRAVAYTSNASDTQAWVYRGVGERAHEIVLAFRGTQFDPVAHPKDILTDLRFNYSRPSAAVFGPGLPAAARVHTGFHAAYLSVAQAVREAVDEAIASHPPSGAQPWRLVVTGHSLGGALAVLGAYDLAQRYPGRVSMVTFGSPRVGNSEFAAHFDALVPNAWRMGNLHDLVTW